MTTEELFSVHFYQAWQVLLSDVSMMFHIPNGGTRNSLEASKLKLMGTTSGVPDYSFFSKKGKSEFTCFIELKAPKGRLSDSQKYIQSVLERITNTYVVNDPSDAFELLIKFKDKCALNPINTQNYPLRNVYRELDKDKAVDLVHFFALCGKHGVLESHGKIFINNPIIFRKENHLYYLK